MIKRTIEIAIILILLVVGFYTGRSKLTIFYYNKGVSCYDRGAYNDAADYFKKSLEVNPKVVLAHYALANAYREAQSEDKAKEEYGRTIQLDRGHVNAYLSLARIYFIRQDYEQALSKLQEADSAVPFNEEIKKLKEEISFAYAVGLLNSGTDAFLRKDRKTAYDLLNKAVLIKNDLAFPYYILGYFYYDEGKVKEAKVELEKSIRMDNGFWFPHKLLGDIYFSEGDYVRAINKYKNALKLNASDSSLYNDLGLALMQRENYAEAVTYLKEAVRLEPENLDIRYNLASVYRDNSQPEEALAEYSNLIKFKMDYPHVHNDIGDIYKKQGKKEAAFEEYAKEIEFSKQRLSFNPNDAVILNNLANAYCGIEDYDLAQETIEKAMMLRPNYRQAYLTSARIDEAVGDYAKALERLNKAKSLSTETGFIDRGRSNLKTILSLVPEGVKFLDKVYLKNGRTLIGVIKEEDKERLVLEVTIGNSTGNVILYDKDIDRIIRAGKKN